MAKLMKFAGIAVTSSLWLVACGDNTSGTSPQDDYCKVVSKNPFVVESVENGYFSTTSFKYEDQKMVEKVEFDNAKAAKLACASYQSDSDYGNVVCNSSSVVAISRDRMSMDEYKEFLSLISTMCDDVAGPEESSSSNEVQNSDPMGLSSSSKAKSSSSVTSSSSHVVSSSSIVNLSSSIESSSSEVSSSSESSSSVVAHGEKINWYDKAWYYKEKVVAANASELDCSDYNKKDDLNGFDVAYEFNDEKDLGRDYIGENHAYVDAALPTVSAECGSLVLDGTNGLLIPLNDIFKSKGFVVEVHFMPTKNADIGNIVVAEPPGSGIDGWQIRLDGNKVVFYARDHESGLDWQSKTIGEVTLNEWHLVRVKIFPSKSGSGEIFYSMNVNLDGMVMATSFNGDISDLKYGLGIGYDAMYQDAFRRKFFTGKIDYIRYGRISEEGL